jgi:hypothetical protein
MYGINPPVHPLNLPGSYGGRLGYIYIYIYIERERERERERDREREREREIHIERKSARMGIG